MKHILPDHQTKSSFLNTKGEGKPAYSALESLELCLHYGEIHAVISNNPSEISRLWENLCFYQEHSLLHLQMFDMADASRPDNLKNEVFLLAPLFPTLSVFENIYMFEPSLYNQGRLLLKSQFRNLLKEYNIQIPIHELPKNLSREQDILLSLLRVYIHQPGIVFIPEGLDCFIDVTYANTFEKLINNIKANGTSVVFLTSQYEIAMLYSDRVSIVRNSKIISTNITSAIQRYPHDFMNLYMGWERIGSQPGNSDIDLISAAPDIKDIAFFNTDLKNTLQLVCSDILNITHSSACQILLTDKKFKIHRTSSSMEHHADYSISEELTKQLLNHENMHPFILNQKDARAIKSGVPFSGCFVCVPIKASHGTSTLILIEYPHQVTLDDRMKEVLKNFAKEISVSIDRKSVV